MGILISDLIFSQNLTNFDPPSRNSITKLTLVNKFLEIQIPYRYVCIGNLKSFFLETFLGIEGIRAEQTSIGCKVDKSLQSLTFLIEIKKVEVLEPHSQDT